MLSGCGQKSLLSVLISSGCHNEISQAGWLVNNRNLFLIVLKAGKSKVMVTGDSVSGESLLLFYRWCLPVSSLGEGVREVSGVFFIRALIPFMRAPPS